MNELLVLVNALSEFNTGTFERRTNFSQYGSRIVYIIFYTLHGFARFHFGFIEEINLNY